MHKSSFLGLLCSQYLTQLKYTITKAKLYYSGHLTFLGICSMFCLLCKIHFFSYSVNARIISGSPITKGLQLQLISTTTSGEGCSTPSPALHGSHLGFPKPKLLFIHSFKRHLNASSWALTWFLLNAV